MTAGRKVNADSHHWCTPPKYVEAVTDFFGKIALDPCSNEYSTVKAQVEYGLPTYDGLKESWNFPTIYVNPPYGIDKARGTSIQNWIQKCSDANEEYGSEILALIPVAVNTRHWKRYIFPKAKAICFLADTRLKFVNGENDKGAPMACAMIYWGKDFEKFYDQFSEYGAVIELKKLQSKNWVSPDLRPSQDSIFSE
jgi:hypothetical protein